MFVGTDGVPIVGDRMGQLLMFLAFSADWVPRERLASLFWPERQAHEARSNVRNLLYRTLRERAFARLEFAGECVRWSIPSDIAHLARSEAAGDWKQAIDVGDGDLLEGVEVRATAAYLEWLVFERSRHRERWSAAIRARIAEVGMDADEGLRLAQRLLEREPYNEDVVTQLVDSLLNRGHIQKARQIHEEYMQRLRTDLDVEPSTRLQRLVDESMAPPRGEASANTPPARPRIAGRAATLAEPLVGRRLETREVLAYLGSDDCRLLTLTGPGGVGKSKLARHVFDAVDAALGARPRYWADLSSVASIDNAAAAIAESVGVDVAGSTPPLERVALRLRSDPAFLFLDGVEHLAGLDEVIGCLLIRCPRLKIMLISRHRMETCGQVYPVGGLPTPDEDELDADAILASDAVALFSAFAIRTRRDINLRAEARQLVRLVRLVEGHPLALQMLAGWAHVLPIGAMCDAVESNLPSLSAGRADRGQGLQASFERSWRLLTDGERQILARLSVFEAPFDPCAASAVADAPLAVLGALADKSLLYMDEHGRFGVHAAIRLFAIDKLQQPQSVHARYARYYGNLFATYSDHDRLCVERQCKQLDRDWIHGIVAWQWALHMGLIEVVEKIVVPLRNLSFDLGRLGDFAEVLQQTRTAIASSPTAQPRLHTKLAYVSQLEWLRHGGSWEDFERLTHDGWRAGARAGSVRCRIAILVNWGQALTAAGRLEEALRYLGMATRRAQRNAEARLESIALSVSAAALGKLDRHADALRQLAQARLILRSNPEVCPRTQMIVDFAEGEIRERMSDWARAYELFAAVREMAARWRLMGGRKDVLVRMASLELLGGRVDPAAALLEEAKVAMQTCADQSNRAMLLCLEAQIRLHRHDTIGAARQILDLLRIPARKWSEQVVVAFYELLQHWRSALADTDGIALTGAESQAHDTTHEALPDPGPIEPALLDLAIEIEEFVRRTPRAAAPGLTGSV
ncbi:hypothetical protein HZ992_12480 [Rhizobacter sp. AJA081-3]|uniref:ATP-binding protein n=1 Tax=Rhizobacter sp. AJA081-3 TaxID=2753607 RepID=UPI001ADEDF96|nr:BTAD domain-containing putative transcriptional regulator [Rhizobacter sp. AJA081-3]QTN25712.1 hypothetical protein HZ992_12480 [Rhizobacter sp. AJA081-3]